MKLELSRILRILERFARIKEFFLHTDAAQGVGKIPIDVKDMNIDLMSISGHKLYGPKGIGALYRRVPKVKIAPMINGGGQERGLRSGTLSPALCVGLGEACAIAEREMVKDEKHIKRLFTKLLTELQKLPEVYVNGSLEKRFFGNLNISFAFIEGESLIMGIKKCAVSSGSACTSESLEPSYVLRALGVNDELAHTSIRFGIGRFTTEEEVDFLVNEVTKAVERLREMSPLWEMHQEGIDISKVEWTQPH
jgi:cysteine desulfurase